MKPISNGSSSRDGKNENIALMQIVSALGQWYLQVTLSGHPIQLFFSMQHWVFVILMLSGAMDHGIPWHRVVYFAPMEQWMEKVGI